MKKEQAQTQTFSPFVKQISGSFNNTSAAVIELIMQFAFFAQHSFSGCFYGAVEIKIPWSVY